MSRVEVKHATRNITKYNKDARSFRVFHGQRISHAIVMTDAPPLALSASTTAF